MPMCGGVGSSPMLNSRICPEIDPHIQQTNITLKRKKASTKKMAGHPLLFAAYRLIWIMNYVCIK